MTVTETDPMRVRASSGVDLDTISLRPPWSWQRRVLGVLSIIYVVAVVWSVRRTGLSITALIDGYSDFRRLLDRMLPIEFRNFSEIVRLAFETFFIAFIGTALAVVISVPLAFLAARNTTPSKFLYGPARGFIVAMRAIPDLIFALIFVRAIGIGVLAGILAIGLHAIGMVGKLFADSIEQIDEGPREAVLATGASQIRALVTGVVPQVMPAFIGIALYRLDINFRTSTILGYVGAGGIGTLLQLYLGGLQYPKALGVVVVIVVLVLMVEFLSATVRKSILGGDSHSDRRLSHRLLSLFGRSGSTDARAVAASANGDRALPFNTETLRPPWTRQRRRMTLFGCGTVAVLLYSFWFTKVSPIRLFSSFVDIFIVAWRLVPRNLEWLNSTIVGGILETLAIGIAASTIGLLVSFPLAFLCARNVAPARWVYYFGRTLLVINRALPELIIAVLFVSAVGLGPFPGVMALSIGTVGFATKLLADSIEEVKQGPRDAVVASGATRIQESFTGVTPQVMPAFIGTSLYVLDINIRSATILGLVGAGGIGFYLIQATRTLNWELVGGILIIVFSVVYAIERLSGWVRKQLL
jgi:phosphonate transport system permease protein